ncbi:8-oxo-dGTP diphosphatase [Paenibacillus albiflavus]|uniref:8-oxo-dGTP diphosphatase n=1 Tax=Paenibacillus albiflavus TaxID=2545760 RepID=A0A4R4EKW1_9BACL|nr:8-oxo-dGTP diphosphatase [Paenibacillus albiflavus]TCZ80143.1 8-oxo-dGTP diphosphatase [Paenibacillus albiflavus]
MLKYNICFVRRNNEILLLNRNKPSWMGAWNGVGGKLEEGETPREAIFREVFEETGLNPPTMSFKGFVTWDVDDRYMGGMYLYLAELDTGISYNTPIKIEEGILDWKPIEWIMHPENIGVASHLPNYLPFLLEDEGCFNHHFLFRQGKLIGFISKPVQAAYENYQGDLIQHFQEIAVI